MAISPKGSNATVYRELGMEIMKHGKITVLANMPAQEVIQIMHRHNPTMKITATECIVDGKKCYTLRKLK